MAGKRPDGDGLVRKRSDGRWEGRIVIGHKDDGSAIYKSVFAKTLLGILGHTNASFTLDTYTHVTTDMQKNASAVVGDFMEELFGSDLQPWQNGEKQDKEPFVCEKTDDGKAESS